MLKRPKGWKLGNKWVGPFRVVKRFGVNYRIVSKGGKVMVVHHDQLRPVSNVEFCMHRIQFTLDSTAIVKFDVCFKRRI